MESQNHYFTLRYYLASAVSSLYNNICFYGETAQAQQLACCNRKDKILTSFL